MPKQTKHNEEFTLLIGKFNRCRWNSSDVFILFILNFLGATLGIILNRSFHIDGIHYYLNYFSTYIITVIGILLFYNLHRRYIDLNTLGLSFSLSKQAKEFLLTFSALGILVVTLFIFLKLQGLTFKPFVEFTMGHSRKLAQAFAEQDTSTILFYLVPHVITILILAPFIEELFFTGIIYPAVRNKLGIILSLLCTGIMFSLFHRDSNVLLTWKLPGIIFFIRIGSEMVSFLLYQITRSLYPSIAYHFFRNIIIMFVEISSYME